MYVSDDEFKRLTANLTICPCNEDGDILKKEYMGSKSMRGAYVTYDTKSIGGWAFAYCDSLKELWLPAKSIFLDSKIFLDDSELDSVIVYERLLNGYNVFCEEKHIISNQLLGWISTGVYDFSSVGSEGWYFEYDKGLADYIKTPDDTGFSPFLAGGEEDYEASLYDIEYYKKNTRVGKASSLLDRMILEREVSSAHYNFFKEYLVTYFEEAMQAIVKKESEAYRYLKFYIDNFGMEKNNAKAALSLFTDNIYAECRALLISECIKDNDEEKIWSGFEL